MLEAFSNQISARHGDLQTLISKAEALGAPKPADVQNNVDELRSVLNRASGFAQNDPSIKSSFKEDPAQQGSDSEWAARPER